MKGGTPKPRTDRSPSISFLPEHDRESFQNHLPEKTFTAYEQLHGPQPVDMRIVIIFAILSILIRVYYIKIPAEIVFDEMHFGGFASKYITARFFFDVHPPLGKLIVAFSGVFSGYDGSFSFEKIGQSYIEGNVPYIAMRVVPALFGSAIVPVFIFNIGRLCYNEEFRIFVCCKCFMWGDVDF
jgi:dolichyl-phosphate-mannose--protein O-mannosyl transferase